MAASSPCHAMHAGAHARSEPTAPQCSPTSPRSAPCRCRPCPSCSLLACSHRQRGAVGAFPPGAPCAQQTQSHKHNSHTAQVGGRRKAPASQLAAGRWGAGKDVRALPKLTRQLPVVWKLWVWVGCSARRAASVGFMRRCVGSTVVRNLLDRVRCTQCAARCTLQVCASLICCIQAHQRIMRRCALSALTGAKRAKAVRPGPRGPARQPASRRPQIRRAWPKSRSSP